MLRASVNKFASTPRSRIIKGHNAFSLNRIQSTTNQRFVSLSPYRHCHQSIPAQEYPLTVAHGNLSLTLVSDFPCQKTLSVKFARILTPALNFNCVASYKENIVVMFSNGFLLTIFNKFSFQDHRSLALKRRRQHPEGIPTQPADCYWVQGPFIAPQLLLQIHFLQKGN